MLKGFFMYDDQIIEDIKKKQQIEKDDRPQLELPLPEPIIKSIPKEKDPSRVITIDLMIDDNDNIIII